jgi:primosomal protein N' (replication factor Y)
MNYAEVAVNTPVNNTFHYHIPEKLKGRVWWGHLVRVAFGTAMQPGIVLDLHDELPPELATIQTKPIIELLDPEPVMSREHIELALWMSEVYLTSPGACLWMMLPPGLVGRSTKLVHLLDESAQSENETGQAILAALREENPQDLKQLQKLGKVKMVQHIVKALEKQDVLYVESLLSQPGAKAKTTRTVIRAIPEDEVLAALAKMKRSPKQCKIFAHIAQYDYPLAVAEVYEATEASSADLNNLERKGLVQFGERIVFRDSLADRDFVPSQALYLTPEQKMVWDPVYGALVNPTSALASEIENPTPSLPASEEGADSTLSNRVEKADSLLPLSTGETKRGSNTFLLHGVTGSGKTEIYLYAIAEVLQQGRQAIFLVPEIALTPQTIRRVAERFPDKVAVVHSSLSIGERHDTWQRARRGEIGVIVGTRSALFTPLPDIGLIILDEEHDHSYKHSPPMLPPYYHARAVAEKMTELKDTIVILGSATPDMETYYRAQKGELAYLHMPNRIMGHRQRVEKQAKQHHVKLAYQLLEGDSMTIDLPPVTIVDMRDELKRGNLSMFSRDLEQALNKTIERGEQAILFLNRRGQASYVFCRDCGYVVECKRCDTPMTYHRHGEAMRCHHCNNQQDAPTTCPQCASERIRHFGAGTQQVEQQLYKTFPDVVSVRWDRDTANKPEHHEAILARFANGEANVMVGTQMIAKGLDLPMVTLVGVISADPGLALPDFRANERAFQLLTQVAGRAGRGILSGQVIIQTYHPQHPSILTAAQHDYETFYTAEIEARRELGYPPFRRLGRVLVQNQNPVKTQQQTEEIAEILRQRIKKLQLTDTYLIGPAPCFFSRLDRHYRWQIMVRAMKITELLALLKPFSLPRDVRKEGTLVFIEVDPVDIL